MKRQTLKKGKGNGCPLYKKCGGCQLQNMTYEEQLSFKQAKCIKTLGKFGHVDEIIGMQEPYRYRNKVQAAFGRTRGGKIISGVYQSSSHNIVLVDDCMLEDETADKIIVDIRNLLPMFKLLPYDEDSGKGFLRHVLVKRGFATDEVMVVLVTPSALFPKKGEFLKSILKLHPEITTVVQSINPSRTSLVLGKQELVLYGKGYIEDILCSKRFRISPRSFYQINPIQTRILYGKAIEFAALSGNETVLDAYCGIGTIGIVAAKSAKNVIAVELNTDAVRDAKINAGLNKVDNIRFYCADAGKFMAEAAREKEKVDVVFMDPPRAGSDIPFLKSAVTLAPKKIVYISCNIETQARDLLFLCKNGYQVKKIQPVDMFPHTGHVETVVLLSHKNADDKITVKMEFGDLDGQVKTDEIRQRADKFKPEPKGTYKMIQQYIEEKYGFKVHTAYIAEVKRGLGLPMYDAPDAVDELKNPRKHPTPEKVEAIKDALRHFKMV